MIRRVTTRGVIISDNKIFCVVICNSKGEKVDFWCTPGGGLDIGESITVGLEREMIEELGIKPDIGKLVLVQQFIDSKGREQLELFFHIKNSSDYKSIDLATTSHGHLEIAEYGFIDPKTHNILPRILKDIDFDALINDDTPPIIWNEIPKDTKITIAD